jgi:NAD(P)H-hydrate epimerase
LFDAAAAGVVAHGLAADAVVKRDGERGLLAGDLLPELRHWVNPVC